jgi:hypothetical protein
MKIVIRKSDYEFLKTFDIKYINSFVEKNGSYQRIFRDMKAFRDFTDDFNDAIAFYGIDHYNAMKRRGMAMYQIYADRAVQAV